jgi:hypothetical protein
MFDLGITVQWIDGGFLMVTSVMGPAVWVNSLACSLAFGSSWSAAK